MFILVVCIILLVLAVALTFYSTTYGTAVAFLALCMSGLMPGVHLGASTYMFWGVAMLIVIALNFILPQGVTASRLGVPYIFTASLAGMLIGLTVSHAAMIVGAFFAALLGGVAYGRTPKGHQLAYPTHRFWNYLCAKGLPAVISFSIIGTTIPILTSGF